MQEILEHIWIQIRRVFENFSTENIFLLSIEKPLKAFLTSILFECEFKKASENSSIKKNSLFFSIKTLKNSSKLISKQVLYMLRASAFQQIQTHEQHEVKSTIC